MTESSIIYIYVVPFTQCEYIHSVVVYIDTVYIINIVRVYVFPFTQCEYIHYAIVYIDDRVYTHINDGIVS